MSNDKPNPSWDINLYEEQPDVGGNRHYDYLSLEEHYRAEESLKTKKRWRDLTSHEVTVLRAKARDLGLRPDIIDHEDRLFLIRCLFSHCENRDMWKKQAETK